MGWRPLRDGLLTNSKLRHGETYGRRLRDDSPYGTRLMGRRDGGAYGTSLFVGLFIARRRDLRDEPPSGTEALTGRVLTGRVITGRRHLRDEHPYGTLNIAGRRDLRDGGAYGTSLRT